MARRNALLKPHGAEEVSDDCCGRKQLGTPAQRPLWIITHTYCRASIRTMPICSTNPKRIGSDLAVARTNSVSRLKNLLNLFDFLEPPAGFEPATC